MRKPSSFGSKTASAGSQHRDAVRMLADRRCLKMGLLTKAQKENVDVLAIPRFDIVPVEPESACTGLGEWSFAG